MLNEEELRKEVTMLERTLRVKLCMQKLLSQPRLSESMGEFSSSFSIGSSNNHHFDYSAVVLHYLCAPMTPAAGVLLQKGGN